MTVDEICVHRCMVAKILILCSANNFDSDINL